MKKRDLEDWELAECTALKNAVDAYNAGKPRAERLSQGKIADALGMNQGSVSSYLNGVNALNARVAGIIAGLIKVPVESFSPRLAKEIAEMAAPIVVESKMESGSLAIFEQAGAYGAAAKVMELLNKHGKSLRPDQQERLERAVADTLSDQPETSPPDNVIVADFSRKPLVGDEIRIAHYDVEAAMGNGKVVHDYPEMFRDITVSQQHLRELGVTYKDPAHLKLISGAGESMAPKINHLDPLIVDASIRDFNGDGVFAFVWQGLFYIKALQKLDADHYCMISANPNYPPQTIRIDETYIQARVLLVWNANRL